MFLIGMYNVYGMEIYPTAISGLGNGFMRAIGLLGALCSPFCNINQFGVNPVLEMVFSLSLLFVTAIITVGFIEEKPIPMDDNE